MRQQKRRRTNEQKKEMTTIKQTEKSVRALLFADFRMPENKQNNIPKDTQTKQKT